MRDLRLKCFPARWAALCAMFLPIAAAWLGGCWNRPNTEPPPSSSTQERTSRDPGELRNQAAALFPRPVAAPNVDGAETVSLAQLQAYFIRLPPGAASGSEKIWQRLDDAALSADDLQLMALNGVRLGLLRRDKWELMARLLSDLGGYVVQFTTLAMIPGVAAPVVVRQDPGSRAMFLFRSDGTLSGADYEPSDYQFAFTWTAGNPNSPDGVVSILPQVSPLRQETKFVRGAEAFGIDRRRAVYSLSELETRVAVSQQHHLVMGPGPAARRSTSVGRLLFVQDSGGGPHETLLVLTMQVPPAHVAPGSLSRPATKRLVIPARAPSTVPSKAATD